MTKYAVCASILMLLSSTLTASAEHDDPAWIVHREYPGPFHLGDENIGSWASLVGSCMDVTFPAVESGGKVQLLYEPYGVENAYLELDDGRRFSLAPQVVQSGTRPNYWGTREYIIIDVLQSSGSMSGRVCSDFLDPTDLDDLMLRNVATWGQQPAPAAPAGRARSSVNQTRSATQSAPTSEAFRILTNTRWSLSPGMPCSLNGGAYLEYGEHFQIGERLTAQGQPANDTENDATKSFIEEDGKIVLRFTIKSNDLVAQYTGTQNTVSANVVRRFTIVGDQLHVDSRLETLDLMELLAGRGVSYQIKTESSVRQACDPISASQAERAAPQVERPTQNNLAADFRSPPFLRCGDTVDCSEKSAVLDRMSQALAYMQSSRDPAVQAFSEVCRDVRRNVMNLHTNMRLESGFIQPQLEGCNVGLREMYR